MLDLFKWRRVPRRAKLPARRLADVRDEMADILIYLMTMANVLSIDLTSAVLGKISKNATKYPVAKSKQR